MVYQSTAPISPGNSGGPLLVFRSDSLVRSANFDAEGRKPTLDTVVGVNFASSASKSAQNLNYAVPTSVASQACQCRRVCVASKAQLRTCKAFKIKAMMSSVSECVQSSLLSQNQ